MQALESNNIKLALMKIRDGLTNLACRLNIRQAGPMYFNGYTNNLFCYLISSLFLCVSAVNYHLNGY
ncbi:MAG: hypothetical protein AB1422_03560 [bacterium]